MLTLEATVELSADFSVLVDGDGSTVEPGDDRVVCVTGTPVSLFETLGLADKKRQGNGQVQKYHLRFPVYVHRGSS